MERYFDTFRPLVSVALFSISIFMCLMALLYLLQIGLRKLMYSPLTSLGEFDMAADHGAPILLVRP